MEISDVATWLPKIYKIDFVNISIVKGNQTIKFHQLIEYPKRNIFFKNYAENEARKLVPDYFLFLKKALY